MCIPLQKRRMRMKKTNITRLVHSNIRNINIVHRLIYQMVIYKLFLVIFVQKLILKIVLNQ